MTPPDPKPARRIPDEGLYTVHFVNIGRNKNTFDRQLATLSHDALDRAMRKGATVMSRELTFVPPDGHKPGAIHAGFHTIGQYTVTPPTLKGDPDEPT